MVTSNNRIARTFTKGMISTDNKQQGWQHKARIVWLYWFCFALVN
jgi:hypothetical protein